MESDLPNYSPETSFTAEQHNALSLLAEGLSQQQIAEDIGVHRNTIRNWRRTSPTFSREWDIAEWERIQLGRERAIETGLIASNTLMSIMQNVNVAPGVRLRAAITILKIAAEPVRAYPSTELGRTAVPEQELSPNEKVQNVHNHAQRAADTPLTSSAAR
jgi:transcriptional regulator with XRE-family HTH domain